LKKMRGEGTKKWGRLRATGRGVQEMKEKNRKEVVGGNVKPL